MSPYTATTRRTFLTGALAATAGVALGAAPASARPVRVLGTQDWMGAVPDPTPLRHLTIPGTHNSGARYGGPWTECQNTTVTEQLDSGIRFLDVRCRVTGDAFAIHHGASYQNMMFGDVLIACRDFLARRPSETVLMRVKQEYSEESDATFRGIFDLYLDGKGWRSLFHLGPALPDLGGARGKVVLLADNGGLPGVRYADPALFDIQDDYMAEPIGKYPKIEAQFRKAAQQPGKLFMNYVSTAALLPPRWNADRLNPRVHAFLDGSEAAGWSGLGVVPLDYPATRSGLVESLIRHNPGA
ncbi:MULTISPECIES: phosphatidylinositol-specific phospholipase C domain-containing protein [Streptomyces]|uniref:phosphatidylinositol-specific phospholipase C domain-containing protein n=1 Tax=Streptomyces TaxID=1883 RepID=UPI00081B123D|nr:MULTISPECIES: phosphatidylinositol-specific phospholipase C domain-containing protein [unclassified Streptomyces]MYQ54738.1 phosphatidylinositol-specific phospholipase C domain-containing protein [Streptomyces sp. SID4941]SCE27637.1 1-phosphatidylinositol phosphodiesterase [Streptomyces sp. PalvLS-984]SDC19167.1 1-phosphatidylinositol phosphodiesterase [Streptomyces sp. AmelKG-A3]